MSVLIATPCYGGMLTVNLFKSLVGIADLCGREGVNLNFLVAEGESAITRGRSNLAATFLRATNYCTLAMIDADISIKARDFKKLLELDKPIRGAAVPLKTRDHRESLSCYKGGRRVARLNMPAEPFEVDYLGGAVMFIEREVIASLFAVPELKYNDPINGEGSHIFAEMIVDGALLTEDYAFCHRAREHGFSVWCHPEVIVGHAGKCQWRA